MSDFFKIAFIFFVLKSRSFLDFQAIAEFFLKKLFFSFDMTLASD